MAPSHRISSPTPQEIRRSMKKGGKRCYFKVHIFIVTRRNQMKRNTKRKSKIHTVDLMLFYWIEPTHTQYLGYNIGVMNEYEWMYMCKFMYAYTWIPWSPNYNYPYMDLKFDGFVQVADGVTHRVTFVITFRRAFQGHNLPRIQNYFDICSCLAPSR